MSTLDNFYDLNPVAHIDQNQWTLHIAELVMQFREMPVIYTPLIEWSNESQMFTGARTTIYTEMLEGDTDVDEIPLNAYYVDSNVGFDTRSRTLRTTRYADKVQLHENSNLYQMWNMNGSRDWRPLLQGALGRNYVRKHELLSRNAFLMSPSNFWTYAGDATDFSSITSDDTFWPDITIDWSFRMGQTGSPVIPGDKANAKLAILPPGAVYQVRKTLSQIASSEAAMWRDAQLYAGEAIKYEIGTFNGIRMQQVPNDRYGENDSVLYNAGAITAQYGVISPINAGDGSPDPESLDIADKVDEVWSVGQKDVTHYIQLESGADMSQFQLHDIISIHTQRTSAFGVTNGNEFRSGKTIQRRIVLIDSVNKRLSFDRPILLNYVKAFVAAPVSSSTATIYAFVTKARHIGMCLVMGARGGIMGKVDRPVRFYEPKPVDDFNMLWRFVWDEIAGLNLWEPHLFELHFCAVALPKPGGIILP